MQKGCGINTNEVSPAVGCAVQVSFPTPPAKDVDPRRLYIDGRAALVAGFIGSHLDKSTTSAVSD
jgi:hypothetical protein